MVGVDVVVGVPLNGDRPAARIELHEPHAALDQPAGQQAAGAELDRARIVEAVHRPGRFRLAREIDGLGRRTLHPESQLVSRDPRRQLGVGRVEVLLVHRAQQVEHAALLGNRTPSGGFRLTIGTGPGRKSVPW